MNNVMKQDDYKALLNYEVEDLVNIILEQKEEIESLEEDIKILKEHNSELIDEINPYLHYGISEEDFH